MRVLRTLFLLMSVASCPFVMSGKATKTAKSHVDEVSMMIGTDGSHETAWKRKTKLIKQTLLPCVPSITYTYRF